MASVTWVGGTHRITDPNVWIPTPIAPGDVGEVPNGHVIALDQTLGTFTIGGYYGINLEGTPATSSFDALDATNNAAIGSFDPDNPYDGGGTQVGSGTAAFVGANTTNNGIEAVGDYSHDDGAPSLSVVIADVASPAGVVIQQGILTNNGGIDAEEANLSITSPSSDAELLNLGGIFAYGGNLTIDVPIEGEGSAGLVNFAGQIFVDGSDSTGPSVVTFNKPVSADQQIMLFNGTIHIANPLSFQAVFAGLSYYPGTFSDIDIDQTVTSASYVNQGLEAFGVPYSTLTLMNGSTLVAELRFLESYQSTDLVVHTGPFGTVISSPTLTNAPADSHIVPIATIGAVPGAPAVPLAPAVTKLPTHGPDLTATTGAVVASIDKLDGYTVRLEGASAAVPPSLNESSITFGSSFALRVEGNGASARFGSLAAIGYNENDGTIATNAGSSGGAATLGIGISDVTSPDGVTILAGAYNNTGAIAAGGGTTIDITGTADSKLINAGSVTTDGMVFIGPTITGTGVMTVGDDTGTSGSLELGGYVATGQQVDLQAGRLTIDDARHFFATVFDFDARDAIVLKGVDVSTVTYNNGALLLEGGADGTLHFHRPNGVVFNNASFVLDHAGTDTIITTPAMTT